MIDERLQKLARVLVDYSVEVREGEQVAVFGEVLHPTTILGAAIVVAAGLFTLWRERVRRLREPA